MSHNQHPAWGNCDADGCAREVSAPDLAILSTRTVDIRPLMLTAWRRNHTLLGAVVAEAPDAWLVNLLEVATTRGREAQSVVVYGDPRNLGASRLERCTREGWQGEEDTDRATLADCIEAWGVDRTRPGAPVYRAAPFVPHDCGADKSRCWRRYFAPDLASLAPHLGGTACVGDVDGIACVGRSLLRLEYKQQSQDIHDDERHKGQRVGLEKLSWSSTVTTGLVLVGDAHASEYAGYHVAWNGEIGPFIPGDLGVITAMLDRWYAFASDIPHVTRRPGHNPQQTRRAPAGGDA